MLTFSFTGVDGTMTECETLTSGMVGKQVQLLFDDSWVNLKKTVVFRAADVNRVVIEPESSLVVIPDAVLERPFGKLFVGVYGTDEAGTVAIPTIMAEGPMIRYGADPMEDETAKALPVWADLQNQIGDLSALQTQETGSLTDAVNELNGKQTVLDAEVKQLQEEVSYLGEPMLLETQDKTSLVGAVNELHRNLAQLNSLTPEAAQLLIGILSKATYSEPQEEAIGTLAALWGIDIPEEEQEELPTFFWDFRSGSLIDQISGTEATAGSNVTLDGDGAHLTANSSYIMFPAAPEGASLTGYVMEVKFGTMELNTAANILRLAGSCMGYQPAATGILWSGQDCWTAKTAITSDFKELNMFSGKTLYAKGISDSQIDWYCEDQLICSSAPTTAHSHMSVGSSNSGAFPLVVEYVKIYPAA